MSNERIAAIRNQSLRDFAIGDSVHDDTAALKAYSDIKYLLDHIDKLEAERMPSELTAENGAKGMLGGVFFEEKEGGYAPDSDEEGTYYMRIPVSWSTIKSIYKMVYDNREALNK